MTVRIAGAGALLLLVLVLATGCFAADSLKQVNEAGITVSYPVGMETQAKKVLQIAVKSLQPSVAVHKQTVAVLASTDAISRDIGNLLGAEEKQDEAKARLKAFGEKSQVLVQAFTSIRLVKKSVAAGADGIDAGVLKVAYIKEKDEFSMAFDYANVTPETLKRTYFPVIVNSDGSIRSEGKLAEMALGFLGSGESMAIAPVHDAVSYIIAENLRVYHPFTRWFNEGVSGWVTRQVIARNAPKFSQLAGQVFGVSPASQQLRDKVNLLAWPQVPYQNRKAKGFAPALEAAQAQYAVELITQLLDKNGATALPKIMGDLNYAGNPDCEQVCKAIDKATGKKSMTALMGYVPSDVRKAIESGEAGKLTKQAEGLVAEKKWAGAAEKLRLALQMTPMDVNARLNLAWVERVADNSEESRHDSEIQVFLSAALLEQNKHSFHLYAPSVEGNYILGRLAILVGNLEQAKQFLDAVLAYRPNHADAKRAMAEIERLTKAAKGGGG